MDAETQYVVAAYGCLADTPQARWEMTFPDGSQMECTATCREVARMIEEEPGITCRRL